MDRFEEIEVVEDLLDGSMNMLKTLQKLLKIQYLEKSGEVAQNSLEKVDDLVEVVKDSVEVIEDSIEVAQDSIGENEPQWRQDRPDIGRTMLKILLPKFY